jgi:hypothetical protein
MTTEKLEWTEPTLEKMDIEETAIGDRIGEDGQFAS